MGKPVSVLDYTKNMYCVDISDSMISSMAYIHKTWKWYRNLFFRLVDTSVLNVCNLINMEEKPLLRDFHCKVISQLLVLGKYKEVRTSLHKVCTRNWE